MHKMEELKNMLCKELDRLTDKGELSASSLDVIDKLTHSIKSIETILAMSDYSGDDNSYARGRGRYARRDSMGRYSSDDYSMRSGANSGYNSGANSYEYSMRGGYSGDDMTKIKDELGRLEGSISDTRAKRMLQEFMQELH